MSGNRVIMCRGCGMDRPHSGRRLCHRCYYKHRAAGTLELLYPPVRATWAPPGEVDQAVVERLLAGDLVPANFAERVEVCRRWVLSGRSLNELARLTGWRPSRYYKVTEAMKEEGP